MIVGKDNFHEISSTEHVAAKACPGLDPGLHGFADNNLLKRVNLSEI
jgi:hypothetical protein